MSSIQIARYIISFSWIYHGLFPKLIQVDPIEKLMTASFGFSEEVSYLITKVAGTGEIIFGLILFIFYKSKPLIILNIVALVGLFLFVALTNTHLLAGAFNPVTTNLPIIGLSVVMLNSLNKQT